jgi:DNA-binding PadR family transcriptional regulator
MPRSRRPSGQTLNLLCSLIEEPKKWRHGYELSKATELMSGTLYPILMRLSERGLLEHKWVPPEDGGRLPRHVYRLTAKGLAHAKEHIELGAATNATVGRPLRHA